jgi:hypothetical protein
MNCGSPAGFACLVSAAVVQENHCRLLLPVGASRYLRQQEQDPINQGRGLACASTCSSKQTLQQCVYAAICASLLAGHCRSHKFTTIFIFVQGYWRANNPVLHTCHNQQRQHVVSHCCLALLLIQPGEEAGLQISPAQRLLLLLLLFLLAQLLLLLLLVSLPVFAGSIASCSGAIVPVTCGKGIS